MAGGHLGPGGEDLVVAFELGQAERRGEVVESVVVAEARMRQPLAGVTWPWFERLFRSSHSSFEPTATAPPSPVVICLFG